MKKLWKKITRNGMCAVILALSALALSCSMDGITANDGSLAYERLNKGYSRDSVTSAKFWKGYAPVYDAIQVWGVGEGWGRTPTIDLDEGTFISSDSSVGTYMPVFGLTTGKYYVSNVARFECDAWVEKGPDAGIELTISVWHDTENKPTINSESQHFSYDLKAKDTATVLLLLAWKTEAAYSDAVIHVENVAFYDKNGNQMTDIPYDL